MYLYLFISLKWHILNATTEAYNGSLGMGRTRINDDTSEEVISEMNQKQ